MKAALEAVEEARVVAAALQADKAALVAEAQRLSQRLEEAVEDLAEARARAAGASATPAAAAAAGEEEKGEDGHSVGFEATLSDHSPDQFDALAQETYIAATAKALGVDFSQVNPEPTGKCAHGALRGTHAQHTFCIHRARRRCCPWAVV
jgi:hypothetical protein